jgi:hypothetical protein
MGRKCRGLSSAHRTVQRCRTANEKTEILATVTIIFWEIMPYNLEDNRKFSEAPSA